jgi:pyruvate dehydrogenase E1 component beta subunit
MVRLSLSEAIIAGLREELAGDERVFCLGQDIGHFGGALQSHRGLWKEFGASGRIIDAPISEEGMTGMCVGAALCGMRPVVEIMFAEFLNLAMVPLANEAAQIHFKTDGLLSVPMVVRTMFGSGADLGHPEDYHSMLAHAPGLKIVMPSGARDAKGLIKSAIRDNNPVVFFEHIGLLHARREEVPDEEYLVPIGAADVKRTGRDVTIVATALMLHRALRAAEQLAREDGIEAEVIDPRTILPLDRESILASVRKTGRLVIVHEAWKTGGSGAEMAAVVAEDGFSDLRAPIVRVAPADVPVPFSASLQKLFIPDEARIVQAVRRVVRY